MVAIGIGVGASHSILFCRGVAIERLAEVEIVEFDKTSTLSYRLIPCPKNRELPLSQKISYRRYGLFFRKKLEQPNSIDLTINAYGKHEGLNVIDVNNFKPLIGSSIQDDINGKLCAVGGRK